MAESPKKSQSELAKEAMADAEVGDLVPLPNGKGALRKGNPGNKGGSGRPTDKFKQRMRALLEHKRSVKADGPTAKADAEFAIEAFLRECLDGQHGEAAFFRALDRVSDRAVGKVPNVSEIRGSDEPLRVIVEHQYGGDE